MLSTSGPRSTSPGVKAAGGGGFRSTMAQSIKWAAWQNRSTAMSLVVESAMSLSGDPAP